ncbi:Ig-like domain-containing protein, partial [Ovoidimarina sediminis]|uniref:Ig-like domain-containing protein n=1 Tax=Ovoidimarina sediminis TaxID=3079856 RepID=UPI002912BFC3
MYKSDISASADGTSEQIVLAEPGQISLPGTEALFRSEFSQDGPDLIVSFEGAPTIRVAGYFNEAAPPDLIAPNGAVLYGANVSRLAGAGTETREAFLHDNNTGGTGGGADDASVVPAVVELEAIGQVETIVGLVRVTRFDGSVESLSEGDLLFQNDVVETGIDARVSLTFVDGTIFSMSPSSRMALDQVVFNPNATDNSATFNLIEGGFVFIAGQVARTGGIDIQTPTASLGIRGTSGLIQMIATDGVLEVLVSLLEDPDGGVGVIELRDLNGNLIATLTETDTSWIVSPEVGGTREIPREAAEDLSDTALIAQALGAYQQATARVQNGGTFVVRQANTGDDQPGDAPPGDGGGGAPGGEAPNGGTAPGAQDGEETEGTEEGGEDAPAPDETEEDGETEDEAALEPTAPTGAATADAATESTGGDTASGTVLSTAGTETGGTDGGTGTAAPDGGTTQTAPEEGDATQPSGDQQGSLDAPTTIQTASFDSNVGDSSFTLTGGTLPDSGLDGEPDAGGLGDTTPPSPTATSSGGSGTGTGGTDSEPVTDAGTSPPVVSAPTSNDPPPNAPPTAPGGGLEVDVDDGMATATLPGSDPNGDTVTFAVLTQPESGTVILTDAATGAYEYTPDPDFTGTDSFTYSVTDDGGLTTTGTITLTTVSNPVDVAPTVELTNPVTEIPEDQ